MKAALQNYHARMQRVLDYIDRHLDGDLDLETVSRVAAFSKFHFHRQFTATFGLSVHRYVQLARIRALRTGWPRWMPRASRPSRWMPVAMHRNYGHSAFN